MGNSNGRITSSENEYRDFIHDAASVLDVTTELHDVVPELMDKPFDRATQRRVVDLLNSDRQAAANAAARRISHTNGFMGGVA